MTVLFGCATVALLLYMAAVLTLLCRGMRRMNRYADREQASASEYREYIKPLITDLTEIGLIATDPRELGEETDDVVAGREAENDRGDEDQAGESLAHDLMVVASSEGAALR